MAGETNLTKLLKSMEPHLLDERFVFVSSESFGYEMIAELGLSPKAVMVEDEGMTLVLNQNEADKHHYSYEGIYACITLSIHSSLDAVGLTAAFANKLKDFGISANVIAGYYHDHIFVQQSVSEQALSALEEFSNLSQD